MTSEDDPSPYLGESGRRDLLIRGSRSLAALAAGGLLGGRATLATPLSPSETAPRVERLTITVVTDSYHHAFERPLDPWFPHRWQDRFHGLAQAGRTT